MAVLSVTQTQVVDAAGTLQEEYEITFTVTGRAGSFTVTVPKDTGDPVGAAAAAVGATREQVIAIYGITT